MYFVKLRENDTRYFYDCSFGCRNVKKCLKKLAKYIKDKEDIVLPEMYLDSTAERLHEALDKDPDTTNGFFGFD